MVDSYEWSIILGIMLTLYINCGIMLVDVDNETCSSPMPEVTCSIKRLTPCASMPNLHDPHAKRVSIKFEPFT